MNVQTPKATAIAAGYRPCAVCLPAQHAAWKEHQEGLAATIPGTRSRMSLPGARLLFREERPEAPSPEILRLWGLDR